MRMRATILSISILISNLFSTYVFASPNSEYYEVARNYAVQMIEEAQKNKPQAAAVLESLKLALKDADIQQMMRTDVAGMAMPSPFDDRNMILLAPFVAFTPIQYIAGLLIHEAEHVRNHFQNMVEFETEEMSIFVAENSLLSDGLLWGTGYYQTYPKLLESTCGNPVLIPYAKLGSEKIMPNELFTHTTLFMRAKNWVGGKQICEKAISGDLNAELKSTFSDLAQQKSIDLLLEKMNNQISH